MMKPGLVWTGLNENCRYNKCGFARYGLPPFSILKSLLTLSKIHGPTGLKFSENVFWQGLVKIRINNSRAMSSF